MEINDHVLKINGSVSIPEGLEVDTNYSLALQGSITGRSEDSNENGTSTATWKFKPFKCEVLTPTGKTIKAKDPRRLSQKLRGVIYATNEIEDSEIRYERLMGSLIKNWELVENYLNQLK